MRTAQLFFLLTLVGSVLTVSLVPRFAQATGGISGAKLATPNTETVPHFRMEFEPCFVVAYDLGNFNDSWRSSANEGRARSLVSGLRFTVGLSSNFEVGLIAPLMLNKQWGPGDLKLSGTGLGDIPIGAKVRFAEDEDWSLAWHGGVTLPSGDSDPGPWELATGEGTTVFETGLIATIQAASNLSFDINLNIGTAVPTMDGSHEEWSVTLELAAGYTFGSFQVVVELLQEHAGWEEYDSSSFSLLAGFTYELSEEVIIVAGPQWDFAGRNATHAIGGGLAFTLLL
jgi:hypothetical protein